MDKQCWSYFWHFHVDYHDPINGMFFLLTPSWENWTSPMNTVLWIIWVSISPVAEFQLATHVHMFNMLNALDKVLMQSCVWHSSDCHACNIEVGRNSLCTSAWTSLYHVNNFLICLYVLLYLTFSTAVYTLNGTIFSHILVNTSEHMSVRNSMSRILLPIFFNSSSVFTIAKLIYKVHIGIFFTGECYVSSYFSLHIYHSMK
jgi:hypothetical protein